LALAICESHKTEVPIWKWLALNVVQIEHTSLCYSINTWFHGLFFGGRLKTINSNTKFYS
jgi:hypothetical protein